MTSGCWDCAIGHVTTFPGTQGSPHETPMALDITTATGVQVAERSHKSTHAAQEEVRQPALVRPTNRR